MVAPASSAGELHEQFGWTRGEDGTARIGADGALVVPSSLRRQLIAFGRAHAPEECCAIGLGPAGEVHELHPLPNVHEQPVTRYEIAASDQLRLYMYAEGREWETTLVFHTHPATEPYPSSTDIALAGWPGAVYAILSLAGAEPLLRAFHIVDGVVHELAVRS